MTRDRRETKWDKTRDKRETKWDKTRGSGHKEGQGKGQESSKVG